MFLNCSDRTRTCLSKMAFLVARDSISHLLSLHFPPFPDNQDNQRAIRDVPSGQLQQTLLIQLIKSTTFSLLQVKTDLFSLESNNIFSESFQAARRRLLPPFSFKSVFCPSRKYFDQKLFIPTSDAK